jgi:hypothetical protein
LAEPDVVKGLFDSHPFLLLLEETVHEVFGKGAVAVPNGILEIHLAFSDLLDCCGVVL